MYFGDLNEELLELAILEHFLKENNVDAANLMNTKYCKREIFERGIAMYQEVLSGRFATAIEWADGERLYETFGN